MAGDGGRYQRRRLQRLRGDAAASKRQKQEIKELKSSQKLLEEDNEVMKGMVDDLQKEVDRLQSELTAAKAALKQGRPPSRPRRTRLRRLQCRMMMTIDTICDETEEREREGSLSCVYYFFMCGPCASV